MTAWIQQVTADLDRHEGFREYAYPDPLSVLAKKYPASKYKWGFRPARQILAEIGAKEIHGQPWTYGHGFTHGVTPDSRITHAESLKRLRQEILEHVKGLERLYYNWQAAPLFVSTVLVNMIYNMGFDRFKQFQPTINRIKEGKYAEAAERLRKTPWFKQVGKRAVELTDRLERQTIAPQHVAK